MIVFSESVFQRTTWPNIDSLSNQNVEAQHTNPSPISPIHSEHKNLRPLCSQSNSLSSQLFQFYTRFNISNSAMKFLLDSLAPHINSIPKTIQSIQLEEECVMGSLK